MTTTFPTHGICNVADIVEGYNILRTGQECKKDAVYVSTCRHRLERTVLHGQTFPGCSICFQSVIWKPLRSLDYSY